MIQEFDLKEIQKLPKSKLAEIIISTMVFSPLEEGIIAAKSAQKTFQNFLEDLTEDNVALENAMRPVFERMNLCFAVHEAIYEQQCLEDKKKRLKEAS